VPTRATGEHEDRTRVICHLPLNDAEEERALKDIIAFLESQRKKKIGVEGYTYSDPSAFFGRWWSSSHTGWMSDSVVLLITDFKIALTDQHVSLGEKVAELKNTVHQSYEKYGRPQEEIWVVSFRVSRYT
jgi:hypothetical protein